MLWRFAYVVSWLSAVSAFAPITTNVRQATSTVASASSTALNGAKPGVVITGGAGGVGFAYAGEFMERGYDVVICDVQDCSSAAKALQDRHGGNGAQIFHTKCDVSSVKDVEKLGEFAQKSLGTIGHWINNAGELPIERQGQIQAFAV